MPNNDDDPPRFNSAGLATGCILALILALVLCVAFDIQPTEALITTTMAPTASAWA